jgi:hypothetical protein
VHAFLAPQPSFETGGRSIQKLLHLFLAGQSKASLDFWTALLTCECSYTLSWAALLFDRCNQGVRISVSDLPALGWPATANALQSQLEASIRSAKQPLWKTLYRSHDRLFQWQWALTVAQAFFAYAPQVCIYNLLRILEADTSRESNRPLLWLWALGLGVSSACLQVLSPR